ncbi:MAG: acetyl-CoA hydrolase/transferase C-terminal domain-containing protein [Wenzhouxiangellaceae bacterium]
MNRNAVSARAGASRLEQIVDEIVAVVGPRIVLGLPLGLGKPNRLANALYRRACRDRSIHLEIVTALSLDVPTPRHWLEARLVNPIVERLYGPDYPRLAWLDDLATHRLPDNVRIVEFYFQPGQALGNALRQRHHVSSNYTHVARDLCDRGVNLIMQLVARDRAGRLSLSCNPDVTLDLVEYAKASGRPLPYRVAQVHPELPFMHGDAVVDDRFFDRVIDEPPEQPLFALPRQPVSLQDHALGFHASRLIADGGTLQIGIGALSDALVHSLILRHRNAAAYRKVAEALDRPVVPGLGDDQPFRQGLYGASEMFMDGFMHLYRAGILTREVFDDLTLMRRINAGERTQLAGTGAVMDGGFFLGSRHFYEFLRDLDEGQRPRFRMHGVGRINQLYGGQEALEIEQRRRARFVNTCMMMTLTGAAVSDGLADYQVVSGVGGQYNFVAMAHAMRDGRSILLVRSVRDHQGELSSNVVWDYPHLTIPRHLRDIVVTEYGAVNLRGRTDEECIQAMITIADSRFQPELIERARRAGKLDPGWTLPERHRHNTPETLAERLAESGQLDAFPEMPFGSDLTGIERDLVKALQHLKSRSRSRLSLAGMVWRGRPVAYRAHLVRLGLDRPRGVRERIHARAVSAALAATSAASVADSSGGGAK